MSARGSADTAESVGIDDRKAIRDNGGRDVAFRRNSEKIQVPAKGGRKMNKPVYGITNAGAQAVKAINQKAANKGKTVVHKGKDLRAGK